MPFIIPHGICSRVESLNSSDKPTDSSPIRMMLMETELKKINVSDERFKRIAKTGNRRRDVHAVAFHVLHAL